MSNLSVSERRIRPIQDAIAAGNLKQALQQCEKWQKKGEKSDKFLALKASILINLPEQGHVEKGKAETLDLCRKSVVTTDIQALYLLQDNLKQLSLQDEEGLKLWDRALAAAPNDKSLLMDCLKGSVADGQWKLGQKASTALRKAFPQDRRYEFWNTLLCHLIHQDSQVPIKERVLFGTLAYRLITKAAELVPIETPLSPGRAIATPDELALLTTIYNNGGHSDEAIGMLQSQSLGVLSRFAKQDPQMVLTLLLESLEKSSNHDLVLSSLQALLATESPVAKTSAEDDRLWRILTRICTEVKDKHPHCSKVVEATLQDQPKCRAAQLARINLLTIRASQGDDVKSDLVSACHQHFELFKTKPFCFDDLSQILYQVDASYVEAFAHSITSSRDSDLEKSFSLKLEFSQTIPKTTSNCHLEFANKAFSLHKTLGESKSERPESALLAALALIRKYSIDQNAALAVQSSFLIDRIWNKYAEFYPAAVRFVQLSRLLGLASLSMDRFASLNIKNMQWETVGYLAMTRISSISPYQATVGDASLSPLGALDAGLEVLAASERSIDRATQQGLEHGSYANVLDSVQVKKNIQQSLNRLIFRFEERKIQNLMGVPVNEVISSIPADLVDLRDSSFLNSYGVPESMLNDHLRETTPPNARWLEAAYLTDSVMMYLKHELQGNPAVAAEALKCLHARRNKLKPLGEQELDDTTVAEESSLTCHISVAEVILSIAADEKGTDLTGTVAKISSWLEQATMATIPGIQSVNTVKVPTWLYLHTSFTTLETLHILSLLVSLLARRSTSKSSKKSVLVSTPVQAAVAEIRAGVNKIEAQIQAATRQLKSNLSKPGVLGKLIDAAGGRVENTNETTDSEAYKKLGEAFASMYDEVELEEYCGRMRESWEAALEGVLAVKLPSPK